MERLILMLLLSIVVALNIGNAKMTNVRTPTGEVLGSFMTTRLGKQIHSFRGIRYAEPPVGQQRFQPPVAVKPWNKVFDASQEGPACPQPGVKLMSEDCLRLNVYTTKLPLKTATLDQDAKRPVLVFFHPGGFYVRSGQSNFEGPQYLLDHDVVLVTVNYRLASLGFLSTGDSLAPGNLGLKDQVEALRWVQKNIAAFGGDPNSVTITGYSAGSFSVTLHLVSPMSKGLFHKAIAMSASGMTQEPLPTDQKHLAKKQAEILGCPTDTTGNMLICLNTKTAEEFAESLTKFFEWYGDPILVWSPVVEPEVNGVERFLPAQPVDLIREGKLNEVPVITGITKDEFGGVTVYFIEEANKGNNSLYEDLDQNWERLAPIIYLYERNTPRSKHISAELKKFYFKNQRISNATVDGIAHLYADGVIGFAVHRFANLMAAASKEPVYFYEFSYQGRYSHVTWNDTKKPYGVVHHDDLIYLFYIDSFPYFEKDAPEIPTVERLTSIWANFAKTGKPIPENNKLFQNVKWERFTPENKKYLEIGNDLTMKTGLYADRMNVWERLFPLKPLNAPVKH